MKYKSIQNIYMVMYKIYTINNKQNIHSFTKVSYNVKTDGEEEGRGIK